MYSSFSEKKSADQAVSILTLVGAVNLPIIKKSVDWWNTLHQPASIKFTESSSISPEMLYPLIISIFGFYLVVLLSGLMAMRAEIAKREINKEWFKIIKKMIYDFNDYNFHVWLVLLITVTLISLNLIVPKIRLNKIKN